jgi:hypothetical protein
LVYLGKQFGIGLETRHRHIQKSNGDEKPPLQAVQLLALD